MISKKRSSSNQIHIAIDWYIVYKDLKCKIDLGAELRITLKTGNNTRRECGPSHKQCVNSFGYLSTMKLNG